MFDDAIKDIIIDELGYDSYQKGLNYNKYYVRKLRNFKLADGSNYMNFDVESESNMNYYDVTVIVRDNQIIRKLCSCPMFRRGYACKHIAACILKYKDELFEKPKDKYELSEDILNYYKNEQKKEELKLEIELDINEDGVTLRPKVGLDKLYLLSSEAKLSGFKRAYYNNDIYNFGVNFEYDSRKHYFNKEDKKIIEFALGYKSHSYGYYGYSSKDILNLSDREAKYLFDMIENRSFTVKGHGKVKGIKYESPINFDLNLNNDDYEMSLGIPEGCTFVENNLKYAIYDKYLYVLPKETSKILIQMAQSNLKTISFKKDKLENFKNGMLRKIKNNINVDEKITDLVITGKPEVSLYFDLLKDKITCKIKLDYDGNIIDYFDSNDKILRDDEIEEKVVSDLKTCSFSFNKNKIEIEDLDNIGDFLSEGISKLSSEYKVYTSKKISNIEVLKKSKVESNFSIGKDNIMTYKFNADNIDNTELNGILSGLKSKKRYYKLKNGSLIDLDKNVEIKELGNIITDLELTKDMVENGNVQIPKYKAFYINSLKENKYKSITTNYSFDEFINNFVKYKNLKIKFDDHDEKVLRDYQKDGVKWLYTLYKCDLGGILADEMGLGKSLQTISFIKQILNKKKDAKIMIVCPTSLVYNWQKEFDKFAPDLKYVTVSESKDKRLEIINDFDKYNVFITSYGLIRNDNDEYENKEFELCVIDEAQTIKNYQAGMTREVKKIEARTKIALTGTPIENSVLELWSIFDFIMPGYLNNIMKFRENYGIKEFDDESTNKIKRLSYQISPFILRRRKKDVSKELPDKVENNIYLDLPDVQKALYVKELNKCQKEMDELIKEEGFSKARFKILQLLTKLRQICVDPSVMYENYNYESVKITKLVEMVKDFTQENHKILIFSSFKRVIENVKKRFDDENISNYLIAGDVSSKKRMEMVENFNKDDTSCFLITLKSGGTGLNLTAADIVIHLDVWWNPQVENQATDRAHRIGQKKKVTVIKMITKGTIEEKIIELQEKKKKLSDSIIEGKEDAMLVSKLEKEDMVRLLSYDKD